ncbi:protein kinase domain-containing protein [Streptomyces sp. NPDC004082]
MLGEGGMGKVYAGQDNAGAMAAVKVLRPELAHDGQLARRFVREAQAARAVTSVGVASVLGAETEGGRPWIATEFLAGPTLDEAVSAYGPLDEAAVRTLAASIARTLADIHAAGFVHRDLKPPNIVLTSKGPRVIDFGIARPEHGLTLTTTGQIPVTPGYGAPEQVLGQRVTPAADVFSLGAVLVYAATGRRAFDGGHVAAVQYEVVHGEPRLDGLSPQLHLLVWPCLAKAAASRPTPGQIAEAFAAPRATRVWRRGPIAEAIKERERTLHQLASRTGAGPRPSRRRVLTGFAAGGAVLTAGGTTAWLLLPEPGEKEDEFTFPRAVETPAARLLSADDGDFVIGGSPKPLWGPTGIAFDGESPSPRPVRDVLIVAAPEGGVAAHNVVDGKRRWAVRRARPAGGFLSLSDRLVAVVDVRGVVRTFVASTGEPKWTADVDAASLAAVDDEAIYVVTKDDRLRSVGRSDANVRWTAPVAAEHRGRMKRSAVTGGGRLVLTTKDGHVFAVDTENGRLVWEVRDQSKGTDDAVRISPELHGRTVYLNGKTLTARRISDGKELWTAKSTDAKDRPLEWGPPTYHAGSVYATAGNAPKRINSTDGSTVWTSRAWAATAAPVLVQGNGVWVADDSFRSEVRAVAIEDGWEMWVYRLPEADWHAMVADGNRVFFENGGTVCALPVF